MKRGSKAPLNNLIDFVSSDIKPKTTFIRFDIKANYCIISLVRINWINKQNINGYNLKEIMQSVIQEKQSYCKVQNSIHMFDRKSNDRDFQIGSIV